MGDVIDMQTHEPLDSSAIEREIDAESLPEWLAVEEARLDALNSLLSLVKWAVWCALLFQIFGLIL